MPPAEPPTLSDKELDEMETLELEEEELDVSFGLCPPRPRGSCTRVSPPCPPTLGAPAVVWLHPGHGQSVGLVSPMAPPGGAELTLTLSHHPGGDPCSITAVGWAAPLGTNPPCRPPESQPAEPSSWIHPHEPTRPQQPPGTWSRGGRGKGSTEVGAKGLGCAAFHGVAVEFIAFQFLLFHCVGVGLRGSGVCGAGALRRRH